MEKGNGPEIKQNASIYYKLKVWTHLISATCACRPENTFKASSLSHYFKYISGQHDSNKCWSHSLTWYNLQFAVMLIVLAVERWIFVEDGQLNISSFASAQLSLQQYLIPLPFSRTRTSHGTIWAIEPKVQIEKIFIFFLSANYENDRVLSVSNKLMQDKGCDWQSLLKLYFSEIKFRWLMDGDCILLHVKNRSSLGRSGGKLDLNLEDGPYLIKWTSIIKWHTACFWRLKSISKKLEFFRVNERDAGDAIWSHPAFFIQRDYLVRPRLIYQFSWIKIIMEYSNEM